MKKFRNLPILTAVSAGFLSLTAIFLPIKGPVVLAAGSATPQAATPASVTTDPGAAVYAKQCAICHGKQREGLLPAFPPLLGIQHRMTDQQIIELIHKGKGRMPAAPALLDEKLAALLRFLNSTDTAATETAAPAAAGGDASLAKAGGALFAQNCAFCHGRDTMGGETGPDLTQSKIVLADVNGDKIGQVVREGRIEKKMPAFNFSVQEVTSIAAFIHSQLIIAQSHKGGRRGVTVADLQTGKADQGKIYFNGAGGCAKCHSPTGDLAGVATRFEGLHLEEQMLYPRGAKSTASVTLPSGEVVAGELAYQDEFTIALRDSHGIYHSWPVGKIKFKVDSPVEAHVEQFPKYTDDDVHNLMAYLQTLR